MVDSSTKYHINPTGRFVVGGPHGDTGLTGRKIIVDTYGGMGRHGGGAVQRKAPSNNVPPSGGQIPELGQEKFGCRCGRPCDVPVAYSVSARGSRTVHA